MKVSIKIIMARSKHISSECAQEQKERWGEIKLSQN
jgi:hypothetical protein